jgi:hypothetical protein
VRLLLDTHIAIWAALDPQALTEAERRRMAGAGAPAMNQARGNATAMPIRPTP